MTPCPFCEAGPDDECTDECMSRKGYIRPEGQVMSRDDYPGLYRALLGPWNEEKSC